MKTIINESLARWFEKLIKSSFFHTEWIRLSDSSHWRFINGKVSHRSGKFFKIVGVKYKGENGEFIYRPFIEQREIGTLGFLLREGDKGRKILAQAKIEPGNVNAVQLSPTCQATKSNILRIHGGLEPPFAEIFKNKKLKIIHSSLQSEQGSRFFGKRNRNILGLIKNSSSFPLTHNWLPVNLFLDLLSKDYLINTDARSVLVCSPWDKLIDWKPFTRYETAFSKELVISYRQKTFLDGIKKIKQEISYFRKKSIDHKQIPLDKLIGWTIKDKEIMPLDKRPFRIKFLRIVAKNREVAQWDQPIISSYGLGKIELICGRINGILHFHFKPVTEAGLYNFTELSPTICTEPGEKYENEIFLRNHKNKIISTVFQSDEGGRFFQNRTRYRIIDIGQADMNLKGFWLTLHQIQALSLEEGWFTNESRSAISLLLSWL